MKIFSVLLLSTIILPINSMAKTCLKKGEQLSMSFDIREYSFLTNDDKDLEIYAINIGDCTGSYSVKNNYHASTLNTNDSFFALNPVTYKVEMISKNKQMRITLGHIDPNFIKYPQLASETSVIYKNVPLIVTKKDTFIIKKAKVDFKSYPTLFSFNINNIEVTSKNQLKLKVWNKRTQKALDFSIRK